MMRTDPERAGRLVATVAGVALLVGPIGFFLVFSTLVDNGILPIDPNAPLMEALEEYAWPALWGSLLGLPLVAYGRSLSVLGTVGLVLLGLPGVAIAWFFIVGIFFGGVSGNPF